MKAAFLPDRGVIKVSGDDARHFLNGLVTTDVTHAAAGPRPVRRAADAAGQDHRRFPASPKLPAEDGGGFLIDCPRALAQPLADQAQFLQAARQGAGRKPVGPARRAGGLGRRTGAAAGTGASPIRATPQLGWRDPGAGGARGRRPPTAIGAELVDAADYDAHRIACGVPRGGVDFALWRRLSARSQHGPAARRRFRQGLLCRPGSGVADAASRHRAHPHRARRARRRRAGAGQRRSSPATRPVGTMGSIGRRPAVWRWCGSTASPTRCEAGDCR